MANLVHVYTANGKLDAETIRLFLVSLGIDAQALGESAGATYGLTIGPLGEVKIYVPEDQEAEARQILADMEAGKYETNSDLPYTGEPEDASEEPEE